VDKFVPEIEQRLLRVAHCDILVVVQRNDKGAILWMKFRRPAEQLNRDAATTNRVLFGDDLSRLYATVLGSQHHDPELDVRQQTVPQLVRVVWVRARVVKDDSGIHAEQEMVLDLSHQIGGQRILHQTCKYDAWLFVPWPMLCAAPWRLQSQWVALERVEFAGLGEATHGRSRSGRLKGSDARQE
jgi:hypothetical protein